MPAVPLDRLLEDLGPVVLAVVGSRDRLVTHPASLSSAGPGSITFSTASGTTLADTVRASTAEAVICRSDPLLETPDPFPATAVLVEEPRLTFLRVVADHFTAPVDWSVHPSAVIHPEAELDLPVSIGPHVVVGRCRIGAGSILHPQVVLYDGTRLGRNVVVHAGTVIGADGFGYERDGSGRLEKFPHLGGVLIEDDVEIGSNTSIDRGTLDDTVIRRGARIDNQVHIAHNVSVGEDAAVIAQAMVGGSTLLGDRSWIAPSACLRQKLVIGADATVGLGAVVVGDVPPGVTVLGSPAIDLDAFRARQDLLKHLAAGSPP